MQLSKIILLCLIGLALSFISCKSSESASKARTAATKTPPQTVKEHLMRVPGLMVNNNGLSYRGKSPLIVLDGNRTNYSTLLGMVNAASIRSVRLIKDEAGIKRWGGEAGQAVVLVQTR